MVFSDASFQDCPDSGRSTERFLFFMQGGVGWKFDLYIWVEQTPRSTVLYAQAPDYRTQLSPPEMFRTKELARDHAYPSISFSCE
jgi:hypothetical protein